MATIWYFSMARRGEHLTIVISAIHFCLVRLTIRSHLFYSNITFVELIHGPQLHTIIVMVDFSRLG
jgi:hypothetical protein